MRKTAMPPSTSAARTKIPTLIDFSMHSWELRGEQRGDVFGLGRFAVDEVPYVGLFRISEIVHRARHDHTALADHDQPIRDRERGSHVVCHHDTRNGKGLLDAIDEVIDARRVDR